MFTKKIATLVKQTVFAALIVGAAGPAIASASNDMILAAAKKETILSPHQMGTGCWTDEGYGRFSSCDAG